MSAHYRIEEWFNSLAQRSGRMNREDICFLMVQARHLIEIADSPEQYRVIAFYADWVVHSALDRSMSCFEMLRDINRVLAENTNPTSPDITREISRIIGFPRLRSEFINLFRQNGLPIILFDYRENWHNFAEFLLWFLNEQPIGFPEKLNRPTKQIRDEMLALKMPYNLLVEALAILNYNGIYHWALSVSGDKKITMMGPVEIAEAENAFSAPP